MTPRAFHRFLALCGSLVLLIAAMGTWALRAGRHDAVVWCMFLGAAGYAAAVRLVVREEGRARSDGAQRRGVAILLTVAIAARCMLLTAPPLSTDIYRYVWDGRVQAAGINPYRYRPADPALTVLRDTAVYPRINRAATALTIYPPFAQLIFYSVTRIAASVGGMKAAMVVFEAATVAGLLALLRAQGLSPLRIVCYVWNPLPLFEFAGSGHIDAAALALLVLACVLAQRRLALAAGVALAAASLVKFFPAVIAPALYRRWGWRLPAGLLGGVALLYLPYLGVGRQVFGFLPGYAQEEGLASGQGFFLLNLCRALRGAPLPTWSVAGYVAVGGSALALAAAAALMRPQPAQVSPRRALWLLALFTVVVSPHLPWYFTWLVPFLCFRPSWALIYLTAAAPLLYGIVWAPGALLLGAALYGPFMLLLMFEPEMLNGRFQRAH